MMFKKKLLATAMATALVSGALVAGSAQAVRIAETDRGQVLLGALYTTANGFKTNITIVNTDQNNAVKAKIVFRSQVHSQECRDFLLYLTPGDVWRGEVRLNAGGQPEIFSDDDSVVASLSATNAPVFATAAAPYITGMAGVPIAGDTCAVGHIEVVAAYAAGPIGTSIPTFVTNTATANGPVLVTRPMAKSELHKIFYTTRAQLAYPAVSSTDPSRVQLAGYIELEGTTDRALYTMTALRDGINPGTAGLPTRVVAHENFDVNVGQETLIGSGFGYLALDNITDMEHALAVASTASSYENGTINGIDKRTNSVVTFPTKYRHRAAQASSTTTNAVATAAVPLPAGVGSAGCPAQVARYGVPFYTDNTGSMQYALTSYDNSENTTTAAGCFQSPCGTTTTQFMTAEVNYIDSAGLAAALGRANLFNATSGWFNLAYIPTTGCSYAGAPTLAYAHRFVMTNGAMDKSVLERQSRPFMQYDSTDPNTAWTTSTSQIGVAPQTIAH